MYRIWTWDLRIISYFYLASQFQHHVQIGAANRSNGSGLSIKYWYIYLLSTQYGVGNSHNIHCEIFSNIKYFLWYTWIGYLETLLFSCTLIEWLSKIFFFKNSNACSAIIFQRVINAFADTWTAFMNGSDYVCSTD